jgi:hypothetical protein
MKGGFVNRTMYNKKQAFVKSADFEELLQAKLPGGDKIPNKF